MSDLLCERCDRPALVIYLHRSLCGPCAVEALDEDHRYLVVQVDDTAHLEDVDTGSSAPA